jgi:4-oxalocrotonate tautomerase
MNARAEIEQVIQEYLEGLYHCDTARLARVFHPAALYATAAGGEVLMLNMPEYFRIVAQRDLPARTGDARKERIVSVDLAGPETALVKLECRFFQKDYVDFLTLLRVDARWQIVAKVFRYEPVSCP